MTICAHAKSVAPPCPVLPLHINLRRILAGRHATRTTQIDFVKSWPNELPRKVVKIGKSSMYFKTSEVAGLRIFYHEAGDPAKPSIVLLHGFPSSSHQFHDLLPRLADRFHVIAPDYPGMGFSGAPGPTVLRPTFDDVAAVVHACIAQHAPGPLRAGRVEEEGEVEKRSYGVDCFGAGRGVANLGSGLWTGASCNQRGHLAFRPYPSPFLQFSSARFVHFGSVICSHFERIYLPVDFGGFYFNSVQSLRSTNLA